MQGLRVITDKERFPIVGDGWTIFYRRLKPTLANEILARHTSKGVADWFEVAREVMQNAIVGWEGLHDGESAIEYADDPTFKLSVIDSLPPAVQQRVMDTVNTEVAEQMGHDLKNSSTTPASSATTTGSPARRAARRA